MTINQILLDDRNNQSQITKAISKVNSPENTKQLKSFIGAVEKVAKLSRKNRRQLLKLTNLLCLSYYNGNKVIKVTTDHCETGLGVTLQQHAEEN